MDHCVRHYEESMAATCRSCRAPFCSRCLVYAFGPKKPPYCIGCALNAGGVRNSYKVTPLAPMAPSEAATPMAPLTPMGTITVTPTTTTVAPMDRKAAKAKKAAAKASAKAEKAAAKSRRGKGRRGGGGSDPAPAPLPPAAEATPIPFDLAEATAEEHDARVPATAQLTDLVRIHADEAVGQSV